VERGVKVTIVVPRFLPHVGGIENHVGAVASGVADIGHSVTVATQLEADGLPACEELPSGVVVRRFPSAGRFRGQGLSPALWRWVSAGAGGADIVHLQNYHALTTLMTTAFAPTPAVLTPHYLGAGTGALEAGLHRVHASAFRQAMRQRTTVICVSSSEAAAFADAVGSVDRIEVIPNGVDQLAISSATPVPSWGRLLVVAGRLEEYKQPQLALEALPLLPSDYRLAFVGVGPMLTHLKRRSRELGTSDRTIFPGRQALEGVYPWYRSAEIVLSLSRRECFGMTVAEGLAAGAAVIASDIGAHRDVLNLAGPAAGTLVPTTVSPSDLAHAIQHTSRAQAAAFQPQLPRWEEVALKTAVIYEKVLAEARS
jgi:glycosyltransferase involved in cell wall biosynthesis